LSPMSHIATAFFSDPSTRGGDLVILSGASLTEGHTWMRISLYPTVPPHSASKSFQEKMSEPAAASEIERLSAEHADLTKRQYEALQKNSYARMSKKDADAYDKRLFRIIEIHGQLAKLRDQNT